MSAEELLEVLLAKLEAEVELGAVVARVEQLNDVWELVPLQIAQQRQLSHGSGRHAFVLAIHAVHFERDDLSRLAMPCLVDMRAPNRLILAELLVLVHAADGGEQSALHWLVRARKEVGAAAACEHEGRKK